MPRNATKKKAPLRRKKAKKPLARPTWFRIAWDTVWEQFETWCDTNETHKELPTWEDQQKMIRHLVEWHIQRN
jgi:hypothetical protein